MKLTIKELRELVRELFLEAADSYQSFPVTRNAMSPETADREQLDIVGGAEEDEELPPHLRDAGKSHEEQDTIGPVPPTEEGDPYATSDPFAQDWNVIPTPGIRR